MAMFAIIDNGAGLFQWAGEARDAADALKAFADHIGADASEISARVYEVTEADVDALSEWARDGSPASEFPLAGRAPT